MRHFGVKWYKVTNTWYQILSKTINGDEKATKHF